MANIEIEYTVRERVKIAYQHLGVIAISVKVGNRTTWIVTAIIFMRILQFSITV